MKKYFLLVVLLISFIDSWSQRGQLIAYVDMEYILENVPEYLKAQNTLDAKVAKWKNKLDKEARHIEVLKSDLANEKAILTKDLIEEKEEEITIKQEELRRLESLYFGPNGDLFLIRKQLVQPIQDQVYNAIQSIVQRRKYDFVFEKSTDLVMLYSNKKYDISELVLSTLDRTRLAEQKKEQKKELSEKRANKANPATRELTDEQKEVIAKKTADKEAQLEEIKNKKIEAVTKQVAEKEAQKKAIEEKRKARLKQREEKRKLLREKQEAARKKKEKEKKEKEEAAKKKKEDN